MTARTAGWQSRFAGFENNIWHVRNPDIEGVIGGQQGKPTSTGDDK